MNFDYRKPLIKQDDKWWLHQYCISIGISATRIKVRDKLKFDTNKDNKKKIRVKNKLKDTELILIFKEFDLNLMKEFNINGRSIKAYEVEEFREDMIACAISLGLIQAIDHSQKDKDGRVLNLLRQISKGYHCKEHNVEEILFNNTTTYDEEFNEVSISSLNKKIDEWTKYCRVLDISLNKFTKNKKWKNHKVEILTDLRTKVANDIYASAFYQFYRTYYRIDKKSQAKANKLLELNLPNINDIKTAKSVVKYSTLANVSSLKK
ncbi:hypothetical protein [Arcobacter arenosus]|uniref:hypothetical protein n=1 Tax=Arcobacter arenosus TaxID=2576037 RepID=UPI003BA9E4B2